GIGDWSVTGVQTCALPIWIGTVDAVRDPDLGAGDRGGERHAQRGVRRAPRAAVVRRSRGVGVHVAYRGRGRERRHGERRNHGGRDRERVGEGKKGGGGGSG